MLRKLKENMDTGTSEQCQICSSKPKNEKVIYVHYGATCCLNCKAFFRRYTRGEIKVPKKKCDLNCDISNKGRKVCKRCRYQKSLEVGMNPEKVLNEEERKKYTHPKKKKRAQPNRPTQSTSSQVVTVGTKQLSLCVKHLIHENVLLTPEETAWISQIRTLFYTRICKDIYYDAFYVSRLVDILLGNQSPNAIASLVEETASTYNARFRQLLVSGLNLKLNDINPLNYGLCNLAVLAKGDNMPSIKHKVHHIIQSDNLEFFSTLDNSPNSLGWFHSDYVAKDFNPEPQKMKILSEKVASFLQDKDIYLLVILHILTTASQNSNVQCWNSSIKRLLMKKLRYLCATMEVEQYLNIFCNQFLAYSLLMSNFLTLVNSTN